VGPVPDGAEVLLGGGRGGLVGERTDLHAQAAAAAVARGDAFHGGRVVVLEQARHERGGGLALGLGEDPHLDPVAVGRRVLDARTVGDRRRGPGRRARADQLDGAGHPPLFARLVHHADAPEAAEVGECALLLAVGDPRRRAHAHREGVEAQEARAHLDRGGVEVHTPYIADDFTDEAAVTDDERAVGIARPDERRGYHADDGEQPGTPIDREVAKDAADHGARERAKSVPGLAFGLTGCQ